MSRYEYLAKMIHHHKPRTIVEFGVGEGKTAKMMSLAALQHNHDVRYMGVDLFDDATEETDKKELNSKKHKTIDEIAKKLDGIKAQFPNFEYQLIQTNSNDLTEPMGADFVFIDGGHSVETIEHDFSLVKDKSKVVVLDDFYVPDEQGNCPDTEQFGANKAAEASDMAIIGSADGIVGGGLVGLAVWPKEAAIPQKLEIKPKNCADDREIQNNILNSLGSGFPFVEHCRVHDLTAVMCSGGPKLDDHLGEIKKLPKRKNRIVCVKHSHDRLIEEGIIPWGCVLLDPRDHVKDFIDNPHPDVTYFVGSMVHPSTLEPLVQANAKVMMYHAHVGAGEEIVVKTACEMQKAENNRVLNILHGMMEKESFDAALPHIRLQPSQCSNKLVGGGTTSAMRGINVLYMLGFRHFKLYGYDSCLWEEPDWSEKTKMGHPRYYDVEVCGENFWTDGELICQYQDLQNLLKALPDLDIEVIGEGLFPHGFKYMERLPSFEEYEKSVNG